MAADFELRVLVLLAFCCLLLVLAHQFRHATNSLFEISRLFSRMQDRIRLLSLDPFHTAQCSTGGYQPHLSLAGTALIFKSDQSVSL